jgi:hypothetical protein
MLKEATLLGIMSFQNHKTSTIPIDEKFVGF